MLEGLNTAAAGMAAQRQRLDALANDFANANTTGYKHGRVGFRDLVYTQAGRPGAAGVQTGAGSAVVDAGRSMSQGALQPTDRTLDVAIQGEGFLRVQLPDGRPGLTRDGALRINGEGVLTTNSGAIVTPRITLPPGTAEADIKIAPDGAISAGDRRVGQLQIATVGSPQGLISVGDNAFVATPQSGPPAAAPRATTLSQGSLEASNVDMSEAMVSMIEAQRSYELASKAISTADQMMEIANGIKRG